VSKTLEERLLASSLVQPLEAYGMEEMNILVDWTLLEGQKWRVQSLEDIIRLNHQTEGLSYTRGVFDIHICTSGLFNLHSLPDHCNCGTKIPDRLMFLIRMCTVEV
jgi:hypothetical protein